MNVNAIRVDMAALLEGAGYTSFSFVPESVSTFPAAIVGPPRTIVFRESLGLSLLTIPITIAVDPSDYQDAQQRLDEATSSEGQLSLWRLFRENGSTTWAKANVTEVEPLRSVTDGASTALANDVLVEVHSRTTGRN